MKNKKGFTLVEVMTVVIIVGILVAVSMPFLIGYSRDARNDRAKSILYLVGQGVKNFRSDFSQVNINTASAFGNRQNLNQNAVDCDLSRFTGTTNPANPVTYVDLIKCSYIPNINYADTQYLFFIGGGCCAEADGAFACMIGADGGNFGANYCAYIDIDQNLHEVRGQ